MNYALASAEISRLTAPTKPLNFLSINPVPLIPCGLRPASACRDAAVAAKTSAPASPPAKSNLPAGSGTQRHHPHAPRPICSSALAQARSSILAGRDPQDLSLRSGEATTPHERGCIGIKGLQTSQDSKEGRGGGVQMPERRRQQTETRQSQAALPSPQEGAASIEGRALWHRGDPTGAPCPSA